MQPETASSPPSGTGAIVDGLEKKNKRPIGDDSLYY